MLYRRVGKSDLVVSEVGLGTMTWGEQTSEQDAHAMLNLAVDEYGVNFVVRAPSEREGGRGKGTLIESTSATTWSLLGFSMACMLCEAYYVLGFLMVPAGHCGAVPRAR